MLDEARIHTTPTISQNDSFRRQLEALPQPEPQAFGVHIYTNDYGLPEAYDQALAMIPSVKHGWMFMVGTGGLFSMLPELYEGGIDHIICIDRDPGIAPWIREQEKNLRRFDWESFKPPTTAGVVFNPLLPTNVYNRKNALQLAYSSHGTLSFFPDDRYDMYEEREYAAEQAIFGSRHFTANKDRFDRVVQTLSCLSIYTVYGDLADVSFVGDLGSLLQQHAVVFDLGNMSNAHDYDVTRGLERALPLLPFHEGTVFMRSAIDAVPRCQEPIIGWNGYIEKVKRDVWVYQE